MPFNRSTSDFVNPVLVNKSQNNTEVSRSLYGLATVVLCLFCVFIVLFNSLLLVSIFKNRTQAWSKPAKQLVYLIICDLIVGLLLIPRSALTFLEWKQQSYERCAFLSYILVSTQAVSYYHILAVCIHRYRVASKIKQQFATDRYKYNAESFAIWIMVTVVSVLPYVIWGRRGCILPMCRFEFLFDGGAIIFFLVLFCIPWIGTNIIYLLIIRKVWVSLNKVFPSTTVMRGPLESQPKPTASIPSYNLSANKKVLYTVGYLLLVFNISILVFICTLVGMLIGEEFTLPSALWPFVFTNNICNPFICVSAELFEVGSEAYINCITKCFERQADM